ncbi:MAG: hypothetical protein SFU85_05650 [Candidatus Methylacidiphilales bacterium]|nr:hypothetical protein [Candidatus Methylacidiphilales bacterium]
MLGAAMLGCLLESTPLHAVYQVLTPDPTERSTFDIDATKFPYNMARGRIGTNIRVFGTEPTPIYSIDIANGLTDPNTSEHALISDDHSISYPLKKNDISFVFELPHTTEVSVFNFFNFDSEGSFTVSSSASRPKSDGSSDWKVVSPSQAFAGDGVHRALFSPVNSRYFRIDFKTTRLGRVGALGLFGNVTPGRVDQVTKFRVPRTELPPYRIILNNLSSIYYGAKITYINEIEGQQDQQSKKATLDAEMIIDDNCETYYAFNPNNATPIMMVDLGDVRAIRRLSTLFEGTPGTFEFYVSNQLLEEFKVEGDRNAEHPDVRSVDRAFFDRYPPFHIARFERTGAGRIAYNFDDVPARFLIMRFIPDNPTNQLAPVSNLRINQFHVFGIYDPQIQPHPRGITPEDPSLVKVVVVPPVSP